MKVHRVTLLVLDFDELGAEEVASIFENIKYPNHCMNPDVLSTETREIGEWRDDHPLNKHSTRDGAIAELFPETKP